LLSVVAEQRHSVVAQPELLTEPDDLARREAENGIRQFNLAVEIIRASVKDAERPFRLRSSIILRLNKAALDGIERFAGTYRNGPVTIGGSGHVPVDAFMVPEEVEHLCDYVNDNWDKPAAHLGAYVLWRVNWIHPFVDGNGRTARTLSYVVLSARIDGLLPGAPAIPDQIAQDKTPYYKALEAADTAWKASGTVDVSELEAMLNRMLAKQLLAAANEASGSGVAG
jgi:Fic family protein